MKQTIVQEPPGAAPNSTGNASSAASGGQNLSGPSKLGIIVFGHGSSVASANDAVRRVAAEAASKGSWQMFETAFLECPPTLADGVAALSAKGVTDVLVLPYFLTLGIHLQRDLPKLVDELTAKYGVSIRVTPPLDGHEALSGILVDRSEEHQV